MTLAGFHCSRRWIKITLERVEQIRARNLFAHSIAFGSIFSLIESRAFRLTEPQLVALHSAPLLLLRQRTAAEFNRQWSGRPTTSAQGGKLIGLTLIEPAQHNSKRANGR